MTQHQFTFSGQTITLDSFTGQIVQGEEAVQRGELSILGEDGEPVPLPHQRLKLAPGETVSCVSMARGQGPKRTTHVYAHDQGRWHEIGDNIADAVPYPVAAVAFTFLVAIAIAVWSLLEPLKVPVWQGFGLLILTTLFWVVFSFVRDQRLRRSKALKQLKQAIESATVT